MMALSSSRPPSPRSVARKKSATLSEERDAIRSHVVQEVMTRQSRLARKSSGYLPTPQARGVNELRFAAGAIHTIYTIHQDYERRRVVDNAAFGVAMIGIALVFVDNEYASSASAKFATRALNTALTALLLALVVWRFTLERAILIKRNVLPPQISVFRTPKRLLSLLMELAICAICVPPGVDGTLDVWEWKYYLDRPAGTTIGCKDPFVADEGSCYMVYSYSYEVLGLVALLRLYMVPRVILNLSHFTSYRTSYLGTLHHVDTQSSLFAVKCFLLAHPFKMLVVAFLSTLLLTSYTLAIVEAPVNPHLVSLANAMWLVMLTMGTIGYGDLNAVTLAGQVLLIVGAMLIGILLFGVLSSTVFSFLSLSERDRRFLFLLHRQEHHKRVQHACASTIQATWRYYYCSKASSRDGGGVAGVVKRIQSNRLWNTLFARLADQRTVRLQAVEDFQSVATELQRCQDLLLTSLKEDHVATMKRLRAVEKRLDTLLAAGNAAVMSVAA